MVVQQAHNLSLQEAVDTVGAMISDELQRFRDAALLIPATSPKVDTALQVYVDHLQAWVRGIYDWSCETLRYTKIEQVTPGQSLSYLEEIL
jgi:hypothetical protein